MVDKWEPVDPKSILGYIPWIYQELPNPELAGQENSLLKKGWIYDLQAGCYQSMLL